MVATAQHGKTALFSGGEGLIASFWHRGISVTPLSISLLCLHQSCKPSSDIFRMFFSAFLSALVNLQHGNEVAAIFVLKEAKEKQLL